MSKNSRQKQALLKVTGRVQGVFYRANTKEKADKLGLTGYARNLPDGSVEIFAQGSEEKIKELIDWCHDGSPSATVDTVEVKWGEIKEKNEGFKTF